MSNLPTTPPLDDQKVVDELVQTMIRDRRIRTEVTRASHMWFFLTYFADYVKHPFAPFHREMFALSEDDTNPMLAIMAFRGSAKSTFFSLSYPIWAILGEQQAKFIVIVGQTQQQARQYLTNLKRELERNDLLRRDLGPFEERDEEWSAGSIVIPKYDARITAISTEQGIRGLRHGSHRPEIIICDDLENLESVKTRESRQKLYQWLLGEVIPAGDTDTRLIIIGNCLHDDGLMMNLKQQIEAGDRKGVFRSYPLLDNDGNCLWPGKFPTPESVAFLKLTVVDEVTWQREFLLRIIALAEQVVHPDWIQYYDGEPPKQDHGGYRITGIGIDLAISQKTTADFTAMVFARVVTVKNDTKVYILPNPINEHLTFPETIERIKALYNSFDKNEYRHVYVENVGYQESVIQQLEHDGIYGVEGVNPMGQDKRARLALTTHHIQSGHILFPREGAEDLIRQLVGFGKESHDDLADAFTILILKLEEYIRQPVPSITWIGGNDDDNDLYDGYPFTRGLRTKLF